MEANESIPKSGHWFAKEPPLVCTRCSAIFLSYRVDMFLDVLEWSFVLNCGMEWHL